MPKISVIIPIYNTEKYLKQCLDSVINQTLKDIEIICVDDCSTDNSLEILKTYAEQDDRIKIIEQKKNNGVSIARNIALEIANGEFITFLDSDDYIEQDNFYKVLYERALLNNSDIVKAQYLKMPKGIVIRLVNSKIKENKTNFCSQFCSAIYKRDLIKSNNINFPIIKDFEDPIFSLKASIFANKVDIVDNYNLVIRKRAGSITTGIPSPAQIKEKFKGLSLLRDIAEKYNIDKNSYIYIMSYWLRNIWDGSYRHNSLKVKKEFISQFKIFLETLKYKDKIIDELYNHNPNIYITLNKNVFERFIYNIFSFYKYKNNEKAYIQVCILGIKMKLKIKDKA